MGKVKGGDVSISPNVVSRRRHSGDFLCTCGALGLHYPLSCPTDTKYRLPPQCAVYGNFSAPKAQEIIVSRGNVLELLRPDDSGRLQTVFSTDVFGCIRALAPFRLTGATRDYLIVGSDSGRLVICEYLKEQNTFKKVHQETFGKSGCRRIVPGQFLAVDPKGRACLTGAGPWQHRICSVDCFEQAAPLQNGAVTAASSAVVPLPCKRSCLGSTCCVLCLQRAQLTGRQTRHSRGQRHELRSGGGEAEAGVRAEPRCGRQSDYLLAAGGAQVAQHRVLGGRHGHGL